jgi:hypothetical protein
VDINEMFPGRYIKAQTLGGKPRIYRIATIEREKLSDGSTKPAVSFDEEHLKFILNRVNADAIAAFCGPNTDDWVGKLIELIPTRTQFGSKMVDAVRVRRPQRRPGSDRRPMPHDDPVGGDGDYDGPTGADELVYEIE